MTTANKIHIATVPADAVREVHDWPTDGMGLRLVAMMRERHGKGGVTVCVPCVHRAKLDADQKRSLSLVQVPLHDVRVGDLAVFKDATVAYGTGGYTVAKVGMRNLTVTCRVRFSPTGPWHDQTHTFPRAHLHAVFRETPERVSGAPVTRDAP